MLLIMIMLLNVDLQLEYFNNKQPIQILDFVRNNLKYQKAPQISIHFEVIQPTFILSLIMIED